MEDELEKGVCLLPSGSQKAMKRHFLISCGDCLRESVLGAEGL